MWKLFPSFPSSPDRICQLRFSALQPSHLLQIATDLANFNARRPRRADLCRATSTAYYALFHSLARACADTMAGRGGSGRSRLAWRQVYRALEHGQAKKRCESQVMQAFPTGIRDFADTFVSLQRRRHLTDYDPHFPFSKSEVHADIQQAQTAISRFSKTALKHRRAFAIHVLMKVRADA